ncbi:YihY/virulence factor BrkB family protein [Streptomyces ficellus]|uniref:YihY/virulence factor BrkB family protein n=1 Tax=Streptomyces ficellus TaxID=1977088 RepID=A0A6I6FDA0_9ACTN|nr:YihY/virulence factor BrkB family protein [Streptomyces ficellus]QGV77115.1 YihY/virulence factor BrkB family protein [Streptomyces ficellus]
MGTVVHVPQTRDMAGEELSGDEAYSALRRYGGRKLVTDSFTRFRYADGFSSARSLGYQVVLGIVPFTIALVGIATTTHVESVGRAIELALARIVPGVSGEVVGQVFSDTRRSAGGNTAGAVAMWLGLGFAVVNLASAMGQIERGCNRIYGIERDRPFPVKYGRGVLLALFAGLPLGGGFLAIVAGGEIGEAVVEALHWPPSALTWWQHLHLPAGIVLAAVASAVIFRWAPRRDQPGYTWLIFGSGVHLVLWVGATALLALYINESGSFGAVYGPLSAFVALLLWANVTGVALFLGIAFAAQLEAARAGITRAAHPDPGPGP